uniref:Leucine-rich repeat-containing N-terminal plant-type domain-containing protein n=1 Tax=Lactuca sativa TaxID=4236 RepID=A0A9R1VH39_LACSA|nr:hypothetical protein LSAT_V11C500262100 [Lactuca sativa]
MLFYQTHLESNLTLSTIQKLDLSSNLFHTLDLSSNELNSSIPVMRNIVDLNLALNNFKAIQDTRVWRLCRLKSLDLSFNSMKG